MHHEPESELHRKAVGYIRRASMNPELWEYTLIGNQHPELRPIVSLLPKELVLVSSYISDESWYVFTTRRVVSRYCQRTAELQAPNIASKTFGNFKGLPPAGGFGARRTEVAMLEDPESNATLQLEFETLYASMAPIYACKFWERRARQVAAKAKLKYGKRDA